VCKIYILYTILLMSVASKTKTKVCTTVVLGIMAALSVSTTWASTTTPGITFTTVNPVESTMSNQDLSVLRSKLKERFSWVAEEVRSLVDGTTTVTESLNSTTPRTQDVSQWILVKPAISRQDFFVDIGNDPYRSYINRLAAYGVLSSSQKFYPQNYFRVDDFAGLLSKIYTKKTGKSLNISTVEWLIAEDGVMTKWMFQQAIRSLWLDIDVALDGNLYDKLIRSEWAFYLVRVFDLPVLDLNVVVVPVIDDYFSDIWGHPFWYAINVLASYTIVNTQTTTFYPDNYLRHYDFVTMFVNSLLTSKDITLPSVGISLFADVESQSSYLSQLTYAVDRGLIDQLITSTRGQLYFHPDDFMSKDVVYKILSKTLNIVFTYDEEVGEQKMTRAEFAQLLVDSFWFTPKIIESDAFSWVTADEMSLVTKLRTLLSML